jgi:hypothetical protein
LYQVLDWLVSELMREDGTGLVQQENAPTDDKVIGFFTQMYAPSQEPGKVTWTREEWEYLAYKVAISAGEYTSVYERVAERCPHSATAALTRLYREILERGSAHGGTSIVGPLLKAFEGCAQEGANGSA